MDARRISLGVAMLFFSIGLSASYYLVPIKVEVSFVSNLPEPYEAVKVTAKLSSNGDVLEYIKIGINGKDIVFPASAYSDIKSPDINSLQINYDRTDKTKIYLYIEYGAEIDATQQSNFVRFVIKDSELTGRMFEETNASASGSKGPEPE